MKAIAQDNASAICRFSDDRDTWRVVVETRPDRDGYHGRFVFMQDGVRAANRREGPETLLGRTREDVVSEAHALPEQRLRQLLRSLA